MATPNKAKEIDARINSMQAEKQRALEDIKEKQAKAQASLTAIEQDIKAASAERNIDKYSKARAEKNKITLELEMYNDSYNQIKKQEYISEMESDKIIDELLSYEKQLETDFRKALTEYLLQLKKLLKEYKSAINEAEATMYRWSSSIHANYRQEAGRYNMSGRRDKPQNIRILPFTGCAAAQRLDKYITNNDYCESQKIF